MGPGKIIGFAILAIIWGWLCAIMLTTGGFSLKNLFLIVATGIIIFVPLYKKYILGKKE